MIGRDMTDSCLNCNTPFADPRPNFCPACGQESNVRPPRLGEFLQQFGGAYFATEGALWRTLKLLLLKPGELTKQYLAGRRKHYVLPLRLYLTISLLMLVVLRLLASGAMDQAFKFDVDLTKGEYSLFQFGDGSGAVLRDGVFTCTKLPAWVCQRLERRIATDPKGVQRVVADLGERAISNIGAAMFVMLPSFALWLKLVYWKRRLHYTEHLVFALHLHTFWFMALSLLLFGQPWLDFIAVVAVPWYALLAMRRVYGGRWWPLLLRALLVSQLYAVVLSFALFGVAFWSMVF
jgi:hypothetical protein